MTKKKVLFIGSFKSKSEAGGVGGQMYACNSLINSSVKDDFDWLLIDTTAESNLKIPMRKKLPCVFVRFAKFLYFLTFKKVDFIILFSSNGMSFMEKGTMAVIAKKISKAQVIFAPRSGRLQNELLGKRSKFGKKVFKNCDKVICQSSIWKDFFMQNIEANDSKFVVQKNWLEVANYSPEKSLSNISRILFMAWIERDKGIFDLIDAVELLVSSGYINFKLSIAGKGKDEEEAKEYLNSKNLSGYIEFKGWVLGNDKAELLKNSDIFVLPSYFEGLPNALLESMASGLACIATGVGAVPDVIKDGVNGQLIEKGNVHQLYNALCRLLDDEKFQCQLRENARDYVETEHSLDKAVINFRKNILVNETNYSRP